MPEIDEGVAPNLIREDPLMVLDQGNATCVPHSDLPCRSEAQSGIVMAESPVVGLPAGSEHATATWHSS